MDLRTKKEKLAYERSAIKYQDKDEVRRFKWYGADIEKINELDGQICNLVPENATVLEVGCGSGRLASMLWKSRPDIKYIGIDIVESNILSCFERRLDRFEFKIENYWDAFLKYEFDFVISQGVLFSTTDKENTRFLFDLMESRSKLGFFCMAIVRPENGITKEDLGEKMLMTKERSIDIKHFFYKGRKAGHPITICPVMQNRIFYVVRKGTKTIDDLVIPKELLTGV